MKRQPGPEFDAVQPALEAWRHRAADVLMIAAAALQAVPVTASLFGYSPPLTPAARALLLSAYAVMAVSALLRRFDYRVRLWTALAAAYTAAATANVASLSGPYALVSLVTNTVIVLVLFGSGPALGAAVVSLTIYVTAPFARLLPAVARLMVAGPPRASAPDPAFWLRALALGAALALMLVLLDRFHAFLVNALADQYRAKADLGREVERRIAAQRRTEDEMRERQRLEREMAAVGDQERMRLGQELHDGVCQELTAALLRSEALVRCLRRGGAVSDADVAPLSTMLAGTIDEAHNIALGLCPIEPDPDALAPSLRALARRMQGMANLDCEFVSAGDVRVDDPSAAQHLYRIAQEALSNAARHARAHRIAVELRGGARDLTLEVRDDGVGIPEGAGAGGMGLRTMAHRAQILDGELTVAPAPGGGTRVACRIPRPAAPAVQAGRREGLA